jgi:tRNA(adenine34) deaminase
MEQTSEEKFLKVAIKEALSGESNGEVPVGAVIVCNKKIISKAHNKTLSLKDPTAHAEILAIRKAAKKIGDWRLNNCEIYVTLEPCPMCASAIMISRLKKVIFGAYDNDYGAFGSKTNLKKIFPSLNPALEIKGGVLEDQCSLILKSFFNKLRNKYNI